MRRLLPYLFGLFVIAYLDRVNVSYAALQMKSELSFTDEVLGFGAGIFFWGYFLLEIPGSILVEKWSARRWIARIMISWGVIAILTGFVQTKNQFYLLRFLLGLGEAGFFPGVIVYLSHWFRYQDRAKVIAMFMAAQPVANIIGSPMSGLLLGINWLGLSGWRWLFIIEGMPAVSVGLIAILLVGWSSDRTRERRWHTALPMIAASVGLILAVTFQDRLVLSVGMFCLAAAGIYAYCPGFWSLPTSFLSGTAAAASIGLINSVGNLGGYAGPHVVGYLSTATGSFFGGVLYLSLSALVAAGLVLSIRAAKSDKLHFVVDQQPGLQPD